MTLLLGFAAVRIRVAESHIAALSHIFSPWCAVTSSPVWAVLSATPTGKWKGLVVLITHGCFAQ